MRLIWGGETVIVPWVSQMLGTNRGFGECRSAAVLTEAGELAAGIVFHNWQPESGVIEISAAADHPGWAQRGVLKGAFGYAFSIAQMAVARCSEHNLRVRRLWRGFGADETIIPRLRGREEAEAILTLSDDAWRASRMAR